MDTKKYMIKDGMLGVCVMVFAVVYLIITPFQVSSVTDGFENLTGRTFPYVIGCATLLLGAMLAYRSFRNASRMQSETGAIEAPNGNGRKVAYYITAIALYALGIEFLGYVVATIGMLVYAMWATGARDKRVIAVTVAVVPAFIYWLFHYVMQIPFPDALLL